MIPPTIQTEKSIPSFGIRDSKVSNGRSHQTTSATPPIVYAARSGRPSARASGTSATIATETPSMKGVICAAEMPAKTSRPPAIRPTVAQTSRKRRVRCRTGSGRFRIAVTMFSTLTRQAAIDTTTSVTSTPRAYATTRLRSRNSGWISIPFEPSIPGDPSACARTRTIPYATPMPRIAPTAAAARS